MSHSITETDAANAENWSNHDRLLAAQRLTRILHPESDSTSYELRVIGNRRSNSCFESGELCLLAGQFDMDYERLQISINPLHVDLKCQNQPAVFTSKAASEKDVVRRRWVMLDIDPDRRPGIPSSDCELKLASKAALDVVAWLAEHGFNEPLIIMSGNGYHLLYPVDMPNDEASTSLVSSFVDAVAHCVPTEGCSIDPIKTSIAMTKLAGSWARKGGNYEGRPYRTVHISNLPSDLQCGWSPEVAATREMLERVAQKAPPKPTRTAPSAKMQAPRSHGPSADNRIDRCRNYLEKAAPAIQGKRGHDSLFKVCCKLVEFDLPESDEWQILQEYNARCEPPFDEQALRHKLDGANKKATRGKMLQDDRQPAEKPDSLNKSSKSSAALVYRDAVLGEHYSPADRGNWGECVDYDERRIELHFVSDEGTEFTDWFEKIDVVDSDGRRLAEHPKPRIKYMTSAELEDATFDRTWIAKQAVAEGQPVVVGGKSKAMKTSTTIDLAISVGTGTPFLGCFDCEQRNVAVISGESGEATIKETAVRIAKSKGKRLRDSSVFWSFDLPQLSSESSLERLGEFITETESKLCVVDPAYLCLLESGKGSSAQNMFDVGPLLKRFVEVGAKCGCTMLLCHHLRKFNQSGDQHEMPELEDLAYGGFAQFFRQWLLLGRRSKYQGDGSHKLWLGVGGSAGHGGEYSLNIEEGRMQDDFSGRFWKVEVIHGAEERVRQKEEREKNKADAERDRERQKEHRLSEALKQFPDGETVTRLKETAGLNASSFGRAITALMKQGLAKTGRMKKKNGQEYDAYFPVDPHRKNRAHPDTRTHPDTPGQKPDCPSHTSPPGQRGL